MGTISVLDKVQKPGIVSIDSGDGRFAHELSSPRSDKSLVLDLASPLYYPSSTSKIYDRSPYRNIGTIAGTTWVRNNRGIWVLRFDGVDDFVDCGDHPSLTTMTRITFGGWFKTSQTTKGRIIQTYDGLTPPYRGYALIVNELADKLGFWCGDLIGGALFSATDVNDDVWHYGLGWYDGINAKIFLDGKEDATGARTADLTSVLGLRLGRNNDPADRQWYDGLIDKIKVNSRNKTLPEIQDYYLSTKDRYR